MRSSVARYFETLVNRFGDGWNRFWFTPSGPFSLCVIRICTGLVALYLHATLLPDLVRFFGPGGWLPLDTVREIEGETAAWSYLNWANTANELRMLHIGGLAILTMFTVGLLTRITSVLALIVVLSTVHRGPMLTSQVEPIVTLVIAYLVLAPSGAYLSLDRLLARRKTNRNDLLDPRQGERLSTAATIATRLIQVHLALIYAVMGLSKLSGAAWWSGMGMWWLMTREQSRLVDMTWLHEFPYVINFWTHAVVLFELSFAVLIWNRLARPLLMGISVIMWTLMALVTGQVTFALMMLVASLAFVPSETMRQWFSCCGCCRRDASATVPLERHEKVRI